MSDFRLKVFLSVARHLSFTASAQELYISQPAITRHIHALEEQYSTQLFDRRGNHIALTEAGRLLMEHCEQLEADYRRLDFSMSQLHSDCAGTLRLGASTTISQYVLPSLLAGFIRSYPHVQLSLLNGNSRDVEQALEDHRIDLGLVEGIHRQPQLRYAPFLDDELVAVTSSAGAYGQTLEIQPSDLCSLPMVLREGGSGTLDVIRQALSLHHISLSDLHVLMYLGSTESIKRFLLHADCIGILSIRALQDQLKARQLQVIEIEGMPMKRSLDFVCLQGNEDPLISVFMQYCLRESRRL